MEFLRNQLPILVAGISGFIMIIAEFIPVSPFGEMRSTGEEWFQIIAAFAIILGILSLLQGSFNKISRGHESAPYAIITLIGFFFMAITGVVGVYVPSVMEAFDWGYNNLFRPLQATMFSILAFFVASAAFRAFRARTLEATLLLGAAFIVMFGRIPFGEMLGMDGIADWIMNYPNTAGQRAIMIGIALGLVSTSLRIILGIERSYMGGD